MYANYASIALYVIVAVVATVHRFQVGDGDDGSSVGIDRELDGGLVKRIPIRVRLAGGAWEWLDVALFAFTTQFFTFPLFVSYSQSVSAKNARQEQSRRAAAPSSPASPTAPRLKKQKRKTPPTWHFFLIACGTGAISIVLVALPLFLGYRQDAARSPTTPNPSPSPPKGMTSLIQGRILPPYIEASFNALRVLQAAYLVLGIPPLWISTLVPRLHSTTISTRWVNDIKWHWVLFVSLISLASFAPPSLAHFVARTASLSTIGFSFLVPAVIHVVLHTFRRPLAIILPADSPSSEDLLLRRKERSLQRKRWLRRAGWDTGVWVFLAPIGLLSWLWWAGRVVGLW
ncbi:hypothetical protein FRB99_006715 [Tulasnella sp. 403]|nr:hypothetical protein FRB99_006715 [Tulasnella sp. 403]